jgi:hypothetical protein
MLSDNDLSKRMKNLDPASTPLWEPLSARAEADLLSITNMRRARENLTPHKPLWIAIPSIAAALVLLLVVFQNVIGVPFLTPSAQAATPPLLVGTGEKLPFGDAMKLAAEQARNSSTDARRYSTSEAWFLDTQVDEEGRGTSFIAPQMVTTAWNEDLSGEVSIVAGQAYEPGRLTVASDALPEGSIISSEKYAAGEFGVMFPATPPDDAAGMGDYLNAAMGAPISDAITALDAVTLLLNEWTLDGAQEAALLEFLADIPGFEPLGHVTDRLDRPGIAFDAANSANKNFTAVLVVSSENGSILSVEKIYVGGIAEYAHLTPPAVTSYIAWK